MKNLTIPAEIKVIYNYAFCGCSGLESVTFGNESRLEAIESYAFLYCSRLVSIRIPDSVTSIGKGAFSGCSGLESMTLPFVGGSRKTASDTYQYPFGFIFGTSSFEGASAVKQWYFGSSTSTDTSSTYYIPDSLKSVTVTGGEILYGAFAGCSRLTSIKIPDSVTSIGQSVFSGCSELTSIEIPDSVTSIGIRAFYGCSGLLDITIPDSVTSIGSSAFSNCSGLTGVYITDLAVWCKIYFSDGDSNPLSYAHHLYLDAAEVDNLTIPAEITEIKPYAFYNCSGLTGELIIPDYVTSIGEYAFSGCNGLEQYIVDEGNDAYSSQDGILYDKKKTKIVFVPRAIKGVVTIPDSVTSIWNYAFEYCSGLESVIIGSGVTSIGYGAFSWCSGLESVIWNAKNCTTAGAYNRDSIFSGCSNLKTVTFDKNVTIIPAYAFYGCRGLTSITIPDEVSSIGDGAFEYCSGLQSVTIGSGVSSIGEYAFDYCTGLKAVYYKGKPSDWNWIRIGDYNGYNWDNNSNLTLKGTTRYYFSARTPSEDQWTESKNWWHYEADGETIVLWTKEQA